MLQIRPDLGRIEKWMLRKAFDDEEQPFLPKVTVFISNFCYINMLIEQWSNSSYCVAIAAYSVQAERAVQ